MRGMIAICHLLWLWACASYSHVTLLSCSCYKALSVVTSASVAAPATCGEHDQAEMVSVKNGTSQKHTKMEQVKVAAVMLFVCTPALAKQHAPNLAAPAVTRAAPVPPPQALRCCSATAGVPPPPGTRVVSQWHSRDACIFMRSHSLKHSHRLPCRQCHTVKSETQAQHQHTIVSHTVMSHPRPSHGSSIHAICVLLLAVCKPTTPHFHQLKLS